MNFLTAHVGQTFTLTELAGALDINLASAHAVLAAMTGAGYLNRHPVDKTYELGPLLIPIGRAAQARNQVVDVAREETRAFADERGLEGLVVGATSDELVILERVGRPLPHGFVTTVGQRIRIVPPLAASFVAFADRGAIDDWLDRSPEYGSRRVLEDILCETRGRGFSIGLYVTDRKRLRRALRELQESPGSKQARSDLDRTVAGLARAETVLAKLDARRKYRVAHLASPVFDAHANVSVVVYVLGFTEALRGSEIAALGRDLQGVTQSVTRAVKGVWPRHTAS
jgi:DNA-binding IclR family transcriptional regulator